MSIEYFKKTASAEVAAVLRASYGKDLVVFSSYSNPTGSDGISDAPQMMTEWGFPGAPIPFLGAITTWEIGNDPIQRINEQTNWWLCLPTKCTDCD